MARPITIVGCGPGSEEYLTQAAVRAVGAARCLIGSKRLLAMFPSSNAERVDVGASVERALKAIEARRGYGGIAVLVSGDPGLCSLAKPVIEKFGVEQCRVIPGVSSVQMAFARLGVDWYDAKIISAHDANPAMDMEALKDESKIAVLAGRDAAIEWSAELAKVLGDYWRIFVCENLSLKNEKITELSATDLKGHKASTMTVVLFIKNRVPLSNVNQSPVKPQRHGDTEKSLVGDSELTGKIIACAMEVHRHLGPGLLEAVYEECLCRELALRCIRFARQKVLPLEYKSINMECGYRMDIVVEDSVVLELKCIERITSVHTAQLLTYMKLSRIKTGLIINFYVGALKDGIKRLVL